MSTDTDTTDLLVKLDGKEEIKATGTQTWQLQNGTNVMSLMIDQRLDMPDEFEIRFAADADGTLTVFDWAKEGTQVELGFGSKQTGKVEVMFTGEVVYVDAEFGTGGSFVTLRGYDCSHRLHRSHETKAFGKKNSTDLDPSDIAKQIIEASGATDASDSLTVTPRDPNTMSKYLPWTTQTPYKAIQDLYGTPRADHTTAGKIKFEKLSIQSNAVATICYSNKKDKAAANSIGMLNARFSIATYPIFAKVRVHGWDPSQKKAFVEEIAACSPDIDGAKGTKGWEAGWITVGKSLYKKETGAVYERVANWCESSDEAKNVAQSIFDQYSLKYLTGEVSVPGCAVIQPGTVVEFFNFPSRLCGKVLVTAATHSLDASNNGYTTTFSFCSNAAGKSK